MYEWRVPRRSPHRALLLRSPCHKRRRDKERSRTVGCCVDQKLSSCMRRSPAKVDTKQNQYYHFITLQLTPRQGAIKRAEGFIVWLYGVARDVKFHMGILQTRIFECGGRSNSSNSTRNRRDAKHLLPPPQPRLVSDVYGRRDGFVGIASIRHLSSCLGPTSVRWAGRHTSISATSK